MLPTITDNSHRPLLSLDELEAVRVTQVARFHECPASWRAMMLGQGENCESQAARTGTAAHLVIERYLRREFELESWPYQQQYLLQQGANEEEARHVLQYLIDLAYRREQVLDIERELRCYLIQGAPPVKGHLDAVFAAQDGAIIIRDHKTNRKLESVDEWRRKPQTLFYSAMARQTWLGRPIIFEIGYVLLGKVITWECPPADDLKVFDLYSEFWDAFRVYRRSNEWPERINENCRYCSVRRSCPTLQAANNNFATAFAKTAVKPLPERFRWVKNVLKTVEAHYEELKTELTSEVQAAGGSLEFGEDRFVLQSSRRRKVSFAHLQYAVWQAVCALRAAGQPDVAEWVWSDFQARLDALVTVQMTALDTLLKELPSLTEYVEPLIQQIESEAPTLTMKARKGKSDDRPD